MNCENDGEMKIGYPKKPKPLNQQEKLERELKNLLGDQAWNAQLARDLPHKWKLAATDLLILPETCFQSVEWFRLTSANELWSTVSKCFKVRRICRERRVLPDELRTPGMELVYGDDPIVTVTNNGIK